MVYEATLSSEQTQVKEFWRVMDIQIQHEEKKNNFGILVYGTITRGMLHTLDLILSAIFTIDSVRSETYLDHWVLVLVPEEEHDLKQRFKLESSSFFYKT